MITSLALVTLACSALLLYKVRHLRLLSFPGIYFAYLSLANLGIPLVGLCVDDPLLNFAPGTSSWYYAESIPRCLAIAAIGIGAFALAAAGVRAFQTKRTEWLPMQKSGAQSIYWMGMLLMGGALTYILNGILTGTIPVLESYLAFREAVLEQPLYPWAVFALATGLPLALATGSAKQSLCAGVLFGVASVLWLIAGNRGEVLFPLAAGLAVMQCRRFRFRAVSVVAFVVAFFIVIPAVRQLRVLPVDSWTFRQLSLNLGDPIVEIGFTLRPLAVTNGWLERGEPLAMGMTYALPFQRLFGLLPVVKRPELDGNPLFIPGRMVALGYSVLAEAYFNFGLLGVVVIMAGIGLLLASVEERGGSSTKLGLLGAIFAVLINNLRNDFLFVPSQICLILLLVAAVSAAGEFGRGSLQRKWRGSGKGDREEAEAGCQGLVQNGW